MEEKDSLPSQEDNIRAVGTVLRSVKERYGDKIKVSFADPRDIFTVWDNIRYRVKTRPSIPAWILDGKKICDGIPDVQELQSLIDENLTAYRKTSGS